MERVAGRFAFSPFPVASASNIFALVLPKPLTMAAAPTFCSEYSAFVEGVVNGACKFLKNRPVGASFCLPDLPVKDLSDGTGYNFRRMVLLDRLIDRMIFVSTGSQVYDLQLIDDV